VHLLARLGRTITQAEWVKELKRVSSLWLKKEDLGQVKEYIANQAEHHKKISFQDELRLLLQQHQVEWDERYIWE